MNPFDYYNNVVLPALYERLDRVFPEFGWKRTGRGWQATSREFTKAQFAARPDRIEVYADSNYGFVVHGGQGFQTWVEYVLGQTRPRGKEWVEGVKAVAMRLGLDCSPIDGPITAEQDRRSRRRHLIECFAAYCHAMLLDHPRAMSYLRDERMMPRDSIQSSSLGLCPPTAALHKHLRNSAFTDEEIRESRLLVDRRWVNRLIIPWRDHHGCIATFAARQIWQGRDEGPKYLFLKDSSRPPFFGIDIAKRHNSTHDNLVIVEGLLDVVLLQMYNVFNVVAIGSTGSAMNDAGIRLLSEQGIRGITLIMDNDKSGQQGLLGALGQLRKSQCTVTVCVVPPERLRRHKDPGEMVAAEGLKAYRALLGYRCPGVLYEADTMLGEVHPDSPAAMRREAVVKAIQFLESLSGPNAAFDSEDLVRHIACRTGYSTQSVLQSIEHHGVFLPERRASASELPENLDPAMCDAILNCVQQVPGQLSRSAISKILRGSASKRVTQFMSLDCYGQFSNVRSADVMITVDYLLATSRLRLVRGTYVDLVEKPAANTTTDIPRTCVPKRQRGTPRPARIGARWTAKEDRNLIDGFNTHSIAELAAIHKRTQGGIRSRLVKLGLVDS